MWLFRPPGVYRPQGDSRLLAETLRAARTTTLATGTTHRPLKVYVLDSSGYQLSGIKPKNVNGRGQATFDLHTLPAGYRLTYFVDAGDSLNDLFWYQSRVPFRR